MLRMRKGAWRANTTRGSSVGSSAIWRVEGATGKPRPAPPAQRRSCCMKPITSKMTARWVSLASPGSNSAWSMPDVMGGSVVGEVWRRGFKGTDCVVGVGVAGGWRRGSHQHQSIGQSQWGGGGVRLCECVQKRTVEVQLYLRPALHRVLRAHRPAAHELRGGRFGVVQRECVGTRKREGEERVS